MNTRYLPLICAILAASVAFSSNSGKKHSSRKYIIKVSSEGNGAVAREDAAASASIKAENDSPILSFADTLSARSDVSYVLAPSEDQELASIMVDGKDVTPESFSLEGANRYRWKFGKLSSNHTMSVRFAPIKSLIITAIAGENGSITPYGTVSAKPGATQEFRITPANGYGLVDLIVDGMSMGATDRYTFSNIHANHSIEARFGEKK